MTEPLLRVEDLKTHIYTRHGVVKAVDGASFTIDKGETLGIVGESGSGKSMTALSILQLIPRHGGRIVGGEIWFDGEDLLKKSEREMRSVRGGQISMILQDPMSSLDPVFRIGHQIGEAIRLHQEKTDRKSVRAKALESLKRVGLSAPEARLRQYPHQLSGGMRQRVSGAIAISSNPSLLIADEPTTALDVTIQAQYLEMLKELQTSTGLAMMFITHDLGIVANLCDRVAVMYAGRVVEVATVEKLFSRPSHPYTRSLLACIPDLAESVEELPTIEGSPPSVIDLPAGCAFAPRCPLAHDRCREAFPDSVDLADGHWARCWVSDSIHADYPSSEPATSQGGSQ
jgi:oligopeptide/dipeptide ABC transporter ATP-binding protein